MDKQEFLALLRDEEVRTAILNLVTEYPKELKITHQTFNEANSKICGRCGVTLPKGTKFCGRCGSAFSQKHG